MKKVLSLLLVLTVITSTLLAKSIDKKALALEMLNMMNKNGYVQKMMDMEMYQRVSQNPILSAKRDLVVKILKKHISFNKLKPKLAKYYARELSGSEIKAFTKFCSTKEGQKILLKMPRLINIGSRIGELELQKHYKELIREAMK